MNTQDDFHTKIVETNLKNLLKTKDDGSYKVHKRTQNELVFEQKMRESSSNSVVSRCGGDQPPTVLATLATSPRKSAVSSESKAQFDCLAVGFLLNWQIWFFAGLRIAHHDPLTGSATADESAVAGPKGERGSARAEAGRQALNPIQLPKGVESSYGN